MRRAGFAAASLVLALSAGCSSATTPGGAGGTVLPMARRAPAMPIRHLIVVVQENRSFDNLFAGYPGADAPMSGKTHTGQSVPLSPITLETSGRYGQGIDIDHGHHAFETEYAGGKMDGFDRINYGAIGSGPPAGTYPYAYVVRTESKAYWSLAKAYALGDHMFSTASTGSFVAHQEIIAGTSKLTPTTALIDYPSGMPWGCDAQVGTQTTILTSSGQIEPFSGPFPCFTQYKTMADSLDGAGVTWKFYTPAFAGHYSDFGGYAWNGFDAIRAVRYGSDWTRNISEPNTNVFNDIKAGALPQMSWIVPKFADSDHGASGCSGGPKWVTSIVNAIGRSRYWKDTAVVVIWDDWGGYYDNVRPPQVDFTSLSFRVPLIVVSPYAKRGYVSHTVYEFGSILKFAEETFGLASLGATDVRATSIADAFDFTQTPAAFTAFPLPKLKPCYGSASVRAIVESDGGYPE